MLLISESEKDGGMDRWRGGWVDAWMGAWNYKAHCIFLLKLP